MRQKQAFSLRIFLLLVGHVTVGSHRFRECCHRTDRGRGCGSVGGGGSLGEEDVEEDDDDDDEVVEVDPPGAASRG
jgi:hypothetical protein